jgi:hypothetical protein
MERREKTVTWGIVITVIGLVIMFLMGHNYSACQSVLGQLDQALDHQDQALCAEASTAHWIGLLVTIAGGTTLAVGILAMTNRK